MEIVKLNSNDSILRNEIKKYYFLISSTLIES